MDRRMRQWLIKASVLVCIATLAGAFALLFAVADAHVALAHAAYVSSIPKANTEVATAPTTVHITFQQPLDPKGLAIVVYDNKAQVVSTGNAMIDSTDHNGTSALVAMKGDGSDIYRVDWQTVSATDGDPTLGAFIFTVGSSDKLSPTTSSTPASTGVSPLLAALIGIVGIVLGAAGTYFVTRPRPTTAR